MKALFAILLVILLSMSGVLVAFPFGKAQDSSSPNIVLSPLSVTMNVGESVPFTVTVPQNLNDSAIFQWYVNGTQVAGESDPSWAFTPTAAGDYSVTVGVWTSSSAYNETTNNSTSHLNQAGMSATALVSVTTSSPTGSFGYPFSSSQAGGHGEQYLAVGSRFMLNVAANVTSISCLMDGFYGNFIYSFAIYKDVNGLLGNLVAQSNQGFINYSDHYVTTWHTQPFASPVNLNPGAYWLMEIDNGSNNNYVIIRSNPNVNGASTVEAGTRGLRFLTTLDSPIYTQNYAMCMFASYTTGTPISSPTPTPTSTVPLIPIYQPIRRIQSFSNGTLTVSTLRFDNSTGQLTGNYASNQTTETLTNTPLQGDVLIAALGLLPGNISSINERGVTWTRQVSQYSVGWSMDAEIWLGRVSQNADSTITFNLAGPPQTQSYIFSLDVCEYSGVATTLSLDQNATNVGFTAFSDTGQTPMTTQPNELWVGAVLFYNSVPQTSPTNNFLIVGGQPNATGGRMSTALLEKIVNQTGTANSGTSALYNGQPDPSSWLGCIATFFSEKQASNPTPSGSPVTATVDNGSTVNIAISGNITGSQISNVTIATNQSATTTTISFTVTGESGTTGFGNITISKNDVLYGTAPIIYIDGQPAQNQGYTQDPNNYYLWYTTHFSTHQISIIFAPTSSSGTIAQSSLIQVVYGVAIAATVVAVVMVGLVLIIRGKNKR